jgi:hypothetical protein
MKIQFRIYSIVCAGLITLFSSCSKQLDVEPMSLITVASFWKTESDAEGGVAGMYVQLRTQMQLNVFIFGEGRSETLEWGKLQGTLDYDRYYLNLLTPGTAGPGWGGVYAAINAANLVLKYVPQIKYRSEVTRNDALAQAHVMRAYCYFVMARTWGDLPLRTEPIESNDPGVILKERAPVAEVFQLIKEDLNAAVGLFSSMAFVTGRNTWTKASAYSMLADVHLWTGKRMGGGQADFTAALNACIEAEKADVSLLPAYANVFSYTNKGNKEIIMATRFQQLESANTYFENMYIAAGLIPATVDQATKDKISTPGGLTVWTASEVLRNQFTQDDSRRAASFLEIFTPSAGGPVYYATIIMKGKGMVENGVRNFKDDIIIYRYADLLLMKAEAKNALGQDPSAEINKVRQRAYGAQYASHVFVNGSQVTNDAAILKERLFELAFEGKRWWDLVRFNKAFELVPSLQSRAGQDYLLLFPIANSLLGLESKVKQNPGY